MREGATVATCFGLNAGRSGQLDPFGGSHDKGVASRMVFNRVEFHTVKIRIVQDFPNTQKLN